MCFLFLFFYFLLPIIIICHVFSQQIDSRAYIRPRMKTKFGFEKFDEINNFHLWSIKMCALLVQQGLSKILKNRKALPTTMFDKEKGELMKKVHNVILLCLGNEILHEVVVKL